VAGAVQGCGTSELHDDDVRGNTLAGDPVLATFVAQHDGARTVGNLFASKADVYFGVLAQAPPPVRIPARDYAFRVVDDDGRVLSTDDLACRRVHVDLTGRITSVDGAVACSHTGGSSGSIRGGMTVGLAPFDDTAVVDGRSRYRLELASADAIDGFAEVAMSIEFYVGASPDQVGQCGDFEIESPEQCDDGNLDAGDGCDGYCVLEPVPPTGPVCGNGVVEDGEACDDGNTSGMDGCDAQCQVEHLCCCGNGTVEPGEQCDDGNQHDGDGCSSGCQAE
jgi:cysteine-rich repeat protein